MRNTRLTPAAGVLALSSLLCSSFNPENRAEEVPKIQQEPTRQQVTRIVYDSSPIPEEPEENFEPVVWQDFHENTRAACYEVFKNDRSWECLVGSANSISAILSNPHSCIYEDGAIECFQPKVLTCKYMVGDQLLGRVHFYTGPVNFQNDVVDGQDYPAYALALASDSLIRLGGGFFLANEHVLDGSSTREYQFLSLDDPESEVHDFCSLQQKTIEDEYEEQERKCQDIDRQVKAINRAGFKMDESGVCSNALLEPTPAPDFYLSVDGSDERLACKYSSRFSPLHVEERLFLSCYVEGWSIPCTGAPLPVNETGIAELTNYFEELAACDGDSEEWTVGVQRYTF